MSPIYELPIQVNRTYATQVGLENAIAMSVIVEFILPRYDQYSQEIHDYILETSINELQGRLSFFTHKDVWECLHGLVTYGHLVIVSPHGLPSRYEHKFSCKLVKAGDSHEL